MEKFEMSFRSNWAEYVRTFNPETATSHIRKIPYPHESFVPSEVGNYQGYYNPSNRYVKVTGDARSVSQNISVISPSDIIIREEFSEKGSYHNNPRVFYLDIETRTGTASQGFPRPQDALEPVCLIQIKDSLTGEIHIIGDKEFYFEEYYRNKEDIKRETIHYIPCQNEEGIFTHFFSMLKNLKPLIVYAWNGEGFDFPYLYNRSKRLGFSSDLFSPFEELRKSLQNTLTRLEEKEMQGKYYGSLTSAGILYLDLLRVYRKFILAPRESYSLMSIATTELQVGKITHREFTTFDDFYQGNWKRLKDATEEEKATLCWLLNERGASEDQIRKAGYGQFVYYGIMDVVLIHNLDKKLGLTKLMVSIAERQSSQLVDVLGTTRVWGNAVRNKLLKQQRIINPEEISVDLEKTIQGGYVREPISGRQEYVISADVNSMYPILCIAGSNMSPETFLAAKDLPEGDLKRFVFKELRVGTSEEQNEDNLLRVIKDPVLSGTLKKLLKENNLCMAPNGVFFRKDIKGVIPDMVKEIYGDRKAAKKEMISAEQTVKQIQRVISNKKEI